MREQVVHAKARRTAKEKVVILRYSLSKNGGNLRKLTLNRYIRVPCTMGKRA
jgi:hypothetical protein